MDHEDNMHDVSESPRLYHEIQKKIHNFWPVEYFGSSFWTKFLRSNEFS